MKTVVIILAVLIVAAGLVLVVLRSRAGGGPIDGLSRHRAHMDALSSDARREVIDRVQDARRDDDDRREE